MRPANRLCPPAAPLRVEVRGIAPPLSLYTLAFAHAQLAFPKHDDSYVPEDLALPLIEPELLDPGLVKLTSARRLRQFASFHFPSQCVTSNAPWQIGRFLDKPARRSHCLAPPLASPFTRPLTYRPAPRLVIRYLCWLAESLFRKRANIPTHCCERDQLAQSWLSKFVERFVWTVAPWCGKRSAHTP